MPALILTIAGWFGINPFRLIAYAVIFLAIVSGALYVRHHYVALGYHKAIADVKKQDDRAVAAADQVEQKAQVCTDQTGFWDVISQSCKLEDGK
ncbi:hypothetical protein IVB03_39580 [Bradyrhizobium sp. 168]|uniref:hypothetical protein n=1 Tax=Bradyrhizobium sp. 168 TaxID=2782639 RepID=UPI001FF7DC10|nr:hypothetical protein [Bradyrhizobium sp. 168]MCK1585498.1 hypothetical protein [Bradyrhizobium sp. 168]